MLSLKIENFTHAKQAVVFVSESRGAIALQVNSTANGIFTYRYAAADWKTEADKMQNNVQNADMIAGSMPMPLIYNGFLTFYTADIGSPYTITAW